MYAKEMICRMYVIRYFNLVEFFLQKKIFFVSMYFNLKYCAAGIDINYNFVQYFFI